MVNGTSFSASVGALIAFESVGAIVIGEVSESSFGHCSHIADRKAIHFH